MPGQETLCNISYFYDCVLPNAYSSGKWTKELLDRAFQWADYCGQVRNNALERQNAKQLDACIREIGLSFENSGETELCLEYLKNASRLLFQAFLQNNKLQESILQDVYSQGEARGFNVSEIARGLNEMKQLCCDLIDSLKLFKIVEGNITSVAYEVEAECFLEHAVKTLSYHVTPQETEKWLNEFMRYAYKDADHMEMLLGVLALDVIEKSSSLLWLQRIFTRYLLQKVDSKCNSFDLCISKMLWSLSCDLLCRVASRSAEFYNCYILVLVRSAQLMKPVCSGQIQEWELRDSPFGPNFTLDEIVFHFKRLCSVGGDTSEMTRTLLLSLIRNPSESTVWDEIMFNIKYNS